MLDVAEYLPIPFVPNGRSREGIDCWGLVCLIYAEKYGINLPLYESVDGKNGIEVADSVSKETGLAWTEIPAEDRREGDVVVLRMLGLPWHIGLILDKATFIHAYYRSGVSIERLTTIHWKPRIVAYYRLNAKP